MERLKGPQGVSQRDPCFLHLTTFSAVPGIERGAGAHAEPVGGGPVAKEPLEFKPSKFREHWTPCKWPGVLSICLGGHLGSMGRSCILADSDMGKGHREWEVTLFPSRLEAGHGLAEGPVEGRPGILSPWPAAFYLIQK